MVKEYPFIGLEALDGVGKSTVVKLIGQEFNVKIYATPPEPFRSLKRFFDRVDQRLRFIFYLFSVIYAGKKIRRWVRKKPVICDRYLLSTLSAHEARGVSEKWFTLMKPIIKRTYPPDYIILLDCNEKVRLRRLKSRELTRSDKENLRLGISRQIFAGYKRWANKLGYNLIKIDTTYLSPEQVKDEIMKVIMKDQYSKAKR